MRAQKQNFNIEETLDGWKSKFTHKNPTEISIFEIIHSPWGILETMRKDFCIELNILPDDGGLHLTTNGAQ